MLTPESIMRIPDAAFLIGPPERVKFEAMRRLLGAVAEEVDMAVITPGRVSRWLPVQVFSEGHGKVS
jgi:hypothetical protein